MLDFKITIQQPGQPEHNINSGSWVKDFLTTLENFAEISKDDLSELAQGIKQSIERNMFSSVDYQGNKLDSLSTQWILKKGHAKNLFHKGLLYRSISTQEIPGGYEVFVLPLSDNDTPRDQVAEKLNIRFPFFGIMPERAENILQNILNKYK